MIPYVNRFDLMVADMAYINIGQIFNGNFTIYFSIATKIETLKNLSAEIDRMVAEIEAAQLHMKKAN